MKDRVPTQIVNGAVRMEQLDADGNSLGYIYLRRADDPTEPGTPYNKNSVLTDETAESLGLDTEKNPTPNDAFSAVAQKLDALKTDDIAYINRRIDAVENLTLYNHILYTSSATFTAQTDGQYRFTLVGSGGTGGDSSYDSSSAYGYSGGGGGGGAVCVVIMTLSEGDSLSIAISDGTATLDGIASAGKGSNGSKTSTYTQSGGGAGGIASVLTNAYNVFAYNGFAGGNGRTRYAGNEVTDAGRGGDVGYYISGQVVSNSTDKRTEGRGLYTDYNLGYGGAGGYAPSKSTIYDGTSGGPAGVVVEYMGA